MTMADYPPRPIRLMVIGSGIRKKWEIFLCHRQVYCWRIKKMQIILFLLFGLFLSILFGMVIIPRILVISHKKRLYDIPDSRKVHTTPVPRLGGLSFFPVILMSMFLVIGFRLYTWSEDLSSLSFNMLYECIFLLMICR